MVEACYDILRTAKREHAYGSLFVKTSSGGRERDVYANLVNMSAHGAGIFINMPLSKGADCEVSCDAHWDGVRRAVVVWCSPVAVGLYRAGVSFA